MSIEPITIPMSIEVNDVTIDSTIETNEVTIESTFDAKIEVSGGGDITVQSLTVTENGTTTAPTGKAYSPVIVNVPASAVDTGTKNITSNGNNQDVVGYAKVNVAVPNSYSAADEGKVVSSGALVSQTSATFTSNGTYDTTTNDEVVVNVSGGTPTLITKTITANGTYSAEDDDADGYSEVTVNVSGGGGISADDLANCSVTSLNLTVSQISPSAFGDGYTFYGWPIETINAQNLTSINNDHCFAYCKSLKTIIFPELTSITANAVFQYAGGSNLSSTQAILVFPKLALGSVRATFDRGYFDTIDIGENTVKLYNDTFYHNTGAQTVKTLILRKSDAIVTAVTVGAINGLRDVYIPHSLYTHLGDGTSLDYQSATNWITRYQADRLTFHDIQGSQYENYYADGTPIL